jgi:anti-sigma28 factor (negative regulator of flagellin synthesis)
MVLRLRSGMDHRKNPSTDDLRPTDDATVDQPIDPERLKKLERLKHAVADGTYHVSAEDLARKLIEHMLQPKVEPKLEPNE